MRAPGPPVRFLIAVGLLWVSGRAAVLTWGGNDEGVAVVAPSPASPASPLRRPGPIATSVDGIVDGERHGPLPAQGRRVGVGRSPSLPRVLLARADVPPRPPAAFLQPLVQSDSPPASPAPRLLSVAGPVAAQGFTAAPPAEISDRRWSGSAFLFARQGEGGVPLAGGGQLGGSQAGLRIAYRIDAAGRLAAAARVYVPTGSPRGSEAAVGIDLKPLPDIAFRLSAERRIAIARDGRDAWSVYAAGGFFKGLPGRIELDGYAQAGIVGVQSRDLFADGAVRISRRIEIGGNAAVLAGAGLWAAAQPGAARIDAGPRLAVRLPAGATTISIAGEWRARLAGDARPGSGPALTVAADF